MSMTPALRWPARDGGLRNGQAYYPNDNYRQIIQKILSGTDPLPSLAGKTISGGRLDLAKALGVVSSGLPVITLTATQPDAYESDHSGASLTSIATEAVTPQVARSVRDISGTTPLNGA